MTMYHTNTRGSTNQRDLGRGDILGLREVYGSQYPRLDDGDVVNAPHGIEGSDTTNFG